jgi:hypothetical protein
MSVTPAMTFSQFAALARIGDTVVTPSTPPSTADFSVDEALLPGYRFVKELARSPLVERWKVQAPDGSYRLAKMIHFRSRDALAEDRAINELKGLQHSNLVPIDFVNKQQARLVIGMEMIDDSLRKQYEIHRAGGAPGVPRRELLDILATAAHALDELYESTAIAHLSLNPSNLLLTGQGVRIADFGLWQLLGAALPPPAECNLRYTAPELVDLHAASRAGDQYSLAVIYQEMLTGTRPYTDREFRTAFDPPDVADRPTELPAPYLESVPAPDRPIVSRALHPLPTRRFDSCMDFVRALQAIDVDGANRDDDKRIIVLGTAEVAIDRRAPHPRAVVNELFMTTIGRRLIQEKRGLRGLIRPGEALVHRCGVIFATGMTLKKLTGFGRDFGLKVIRAEHGLVIYHMHLTGGSLLRWGKKPILEIQVSIGKPRVAETRLMEAEMSFKPLNCSAEQAAQALKEIAPAVVEKLRMYLAADPEYRLQERVPYELPLTVSLVLLHGQTAPPVEAVGKDLSLGGMGFHAPADFPVTQYVLLHLNVGEPPHPAIVPARVGRCQNCGQGWFEVGVRFVTDT